jgi:aryl-alcohol dehydrogenase-like predicted oxidoreductase
METITLGRTDLKVSRIAFGTWQLADAVDAADIRPDQADLAEIDRILVDTVPMVGPSPEGS